jgi:hypothetical protein
MKHECTQMRRNKDIQSIEGRMAYGLYMHWMQKQKRQGPSVDTFLVSAYYTSFTKFAEWVRATGIPEPEKYVELMIDAKISPTNWRRTEAYLIYLEYADKIAKPITQAMTSISTLAALAEMLECDINQVFDYYNAGQIGDLIIQRRLSPYLLFCSKVFQKWTSKLDPHDRSNLMQSIGIDWWSVRLERVPEAEIKEIRELIEMSEL